MSEIGSNKLLLPDFRSYSRVLFQTTNLGFPWNPLYFIGLKVK